MKRHKDERLKVILRFALTQIMLTIRRDKSLNSMNKQHPPSIGPSGRWLIFFGIPMAILGILLTFTMRHGLDKGLVHAFGETALPYVIFFTPVVIGIGGMVLYEHFPKRLVIPFGIVGWIVGLSLIFWYFWFGPGAFGHH
jgi:hypothetical protein